MTDIPLLDGWQFNVGIDLENIGRWQELLPKLEQSPNKELFFQEEHEYCRSFSDAATHYAGHWCAKEAVVKALTPFFEITTRNVRIFHDQTGRPLVELRNIKNQSLIPEIRLSISHNPDMAIAFAMAVGRAEPNRT